MPVDASTPGLNTMQPKTKQNPNVKYTPPPADALASELMPARPPWNGTGAAKPSPVLIATVIAPVPLSNTRSTRPRLAGGERVAEVECDIAVVVRLVRQSVAVDVDQVEGRVGLAATEVPADAQR